MGGLTALDFGTTRKLRVCMYKKKQQTEREENRAKRRSEKKWEVENRPFVRLLDHSERYSSRVEGDRTYPHSKAEA